MPVFTYQGYKNDGSAAKGTVEANGQRDAVIKIKAIGVFPKEITEAVFLKKKIFSWKRLPSILPDITRNLSTLLSSGVPLTEAVGTIASEQKGQWKNILIDIKDRLSAGATLAKATQAYPSIFPEFYTGMVSAGENSGRLTEVLSKLADFLETQNSIKNKAQTALIYPLLMAVISVIIISFLFAFVVPKITKMFESTSAALPLITVILLWISTAFHKFWWLLLLLASGALVFYQWLRKTKKEIIDSILLKSPFGILQSLYMARFSLTMSYLLSGGLPILNVMQISSGATGNTVLEKRIRTARNLVSQGARLSTSLEGFPPIFLQMISTGEDSGKLAESLKRTALSYEAEFDRKLQRAVSLLEPILILVMGFIVAFIVIAILLPILELNQLIK
ncbi:MAG: type II secretion system F family protein [Thermodesulfovibrionia bacterium]